jgi:diaminohydroxyphosphoribosylaminopyrimidine deaminase / 5-amino-6-(5-phosphoribosylamino)uracil reductase
MNDHYYMNLAIQMAKSTIGQTSPNPSVGCIIVKDGNILGMGSHLKAGLPHAEINALEMANYDAAGSTVYVTLEPCSHYGKTPPCAEALVNANVSRVVIADSMDLNPLVSGKGIEILKQSGIQVDTGIMQQEAAALNEAFKHYIVTGRPFVTLKTASTLDGKISSYNGHSEWITGREAREQVHNLRHRNDAILVGIGTVLADNPSLTTRLPQGEGNHPIRVILDSTLKIPYTSKLLKDKKTPIIIFATSKADIEKKKELEAMGVEVILTSGDRINLHEVLDILGKRQITSILVEGGSEVNGSFLEENLINKVITYISPKILGGKSGITSFGGLGYENMGKALKLKNVKVSMVGEDIKIVGTPTK